MFEKFDLLHWIISIFDQNSRNWSFRGCERSRTKLTGWNVPPTTFSKKIIIFHKNLWKCYHSILYIFFLLNSTFCTLAIFHFCTFASCISASLHICTFASLHFCTFCTFFALLHNHIMISMLLIYDLHFFVYTCTKLCVWKHVPNFAQKTFSKFKKIFHALLSPANFLLITNVTHFFLYTFFHSIMSHAFFSIYLFVTSNSVYKK